MEDQNRTNDASPIVDRSTRSEAIDRRRRSGAASPWKRRGRWCGAAWAPLARPATRRHGSGIAQVLFCLLVVAPSALAQQTFWKNDLLGDWFISTNWSPAVPTTTHDAIFGRSSAGSGGLISAPGAVAQNVFLGVVVTGTGGGGNGTLTLAPPGGGGPPGNLTIGNRLVIGQANATVVGNGTLNISGGSDVFSNSIDVAITSNGPFGTINVTDSGSNLNTGRLTLGNDTGHGVLNIQNGGVVSCQNEGLIAGSPLLTGSSAATGAATISGAGSKWIVNAGFVVGYNANGSLTVSNGGQMQSLEASIATLPGSIGTVSVTGANSRWVAIPFTNIFVGGWSGSTASGGAGSISVFNGGQVIASLIKIFSTGFVQVDNGSTSTPGLIARGVPPAHTVGGTLGDISIGHMNSGRTEIRDGGAVRDNRGFIGFGSGSNGAMLVTGQDTAPSLWQNNGSVWVGNGGNGTLEVREGASVTSGGNGYLAFASNTTGYALVSGTGSLWQMSANLYVGGNGAGPGGSGTLQIENSGRVQAAAITLYNTGTLVLGNDPILTGQLTALGGSIQAINDTTLSKDFTIGAGGLHVLTNFLNVTFTGVISGSGTLDKSGGFTVGPGTLTLTGNNTYSGGTTVSAGRLLVNNPSGSGTGSGPVTVSTISGNTVLGGSGTITGPVTINSSSILLGGRGIAASGALTVANDVTLNPGAKIQLVLGASGAHSTLSRTAGTWTFPGNLAFRFTATGAAPGFYDNIITGLSDDPGNVGTWTIETAGFSGTFSYDGTGNVDLNLTGAPPPTSCNWISGPAYPIPVMDNAAATVGTALYSFGGVSNGVIIANSYKFDGTGWTAIAALPEPLEAPAVVSDGTFAYIMGGYSLDSPAGTRSTLYRYDPVGDSYLSLANSTVAAWGSCGAFLNGRLYKIGGLKNDNSGSNAVEVYNVNTDSWSAAANYPLSVGLVSAFARNGFVYAAGGANSSGLFTAKAYRYDPTANTWSDGAIADLPDSRWGAATLPETSGTVLAGGIVANAISASAIRWDPGSNTWSGLPDMLQPRSRGTGAVLASSLSVIGGQAPEDGIYSFIGSTDHQIQACPQVVFTVTTADDHDDATCNAADCTLREAIVAANAHTGTDIINFAPGVTGIIELMSALPNLSSDIVLQGPGADLLTVRRNSGADYRILSIGVGTSVTLSDLTIADGRASGAFPANCGGGIYADHANLTLVNVALNGNTATLHGGAIFNAQSGITLSNCTLNQNSAAASGGGIFNFGIGGVATLSLTNCTVNQNAASQYGGAIYNDGTGGGNASLTLTNCTFNQNTATLIAGGIYHDALNPGSSGTATLHMANTILNAGASGANLVNDGASIISDGHNLSSDDAGGFLTGDGDIADTDPQLDPAGLTNNGGPTRTVALLATSPALDAGDDILAPLDDQRGLRRNGPSDIGAFEFAGLVPTPTPMPTSTPTPTPGTPTPTPTPTPSPSPTPSPIPTPCMSTVVSYSDAPVAIPDADPIGVDVTVMVSGVGPITHLAFRFDGTASSADPTSTTVGVNHSFIGDLTFKLRSPLGTTVTIFNRPTGGLGGCSSNNLYQLTLDDWTGFAVGTHCPGNNSAGPQTGNFMPENPLAAFNGEDPNGTWTLTAIDNAGVDIGSIRAFSLLLSTDCPNATPTPSAVSISGSATYCSNPGIPPVSGATMTLTGDEGGSTLTDASGNYTFSSLASGGTYTVTPSKAALPPASAGIDTVDVVAAQRHFLNLGIPLSGCRLTAADVNSDTTVNTVDVIAIQRFFLGTTIGIANVGKYQFTPANRSYPNIVSDQIGQDYDVLVFGDVTSGFVHRPEG